ncbi:MAG: hypothetical protein ACTSVI_07735 [Promethearchaeota archaeon]
MARETKKNQIKNASIALVLVFIGILAVMLPIANQYARKPPHVEKLVFANLYSWYGTPSGPAGQWVFRDFQKNGSTNEWNATGSTMFNVTSGMKPGNGSIFYASGEVVNPSNNTLCLSTIANNFPLYKMRDPLSGEITYRRLYFSFNLSISNPNSRVIFELIVDGTSFQAVLDVNGSFATIYKVFPNDFTKNSSNEDNALKIILHGNSTGNYTINVKSMNIGMWTHYNEDILTYYDNDKKGWYNYPPFTKATDKNVYFPGNISDALGSIPSYGNYTHHWVELGGEHLNESIAPSSYLGIYDSLDPQVIEAQLRLMNWAGIDVVMLMHPWSFDVAEIIMDVAWNIKTRFDQLGNGSVFNIRFAYYSSYESMQALLPQIKDYEHFNELYLKVNDKLVFFSGPTGLLSEPYANFKQAFDAIRLAHPDVFILGDGYLPPKEEMLTLLDGFYFYDTSGLMRQGYGDPDITVYQPDGSPSYGYGVLDYIFGATAKEVHAHGLIYASTVIPGTDNTCVHDFEGSPLYDGRPGTIVNRESGLTFNYTWSSSIAANADWVTITSWNELHEGTEIEPTLENGTFYIQSCRQWASIFKGG